MVTWHKLELSERRELQLRKCLIKSVCGALSLLVIDKERVQSIVGGVSPGPVVPGSIRK